MMHAALTRVSLVTEVDVPRPQPDQRYFEDPAHYGAELSRVVLHEATHYWQQLSSPWLLLLAAEDWERLLRFVQRGSADPAGPFRTEFGRVDPQAAFSVRDLVECTSRYWDVLNVGPHNLIDAEIDGGRTIDPDLRAGYESLVASGRFRSDDDGYSPATASLAMRMIGGSY